MPLSWNEIRSRAITFSREWCDATRERAEAQTFWNEFFHIFGIRRRTVASFEEPVRNMGGATDFIDLFWKGRLIAEHKSRVNIRHFAFVAGYETRRLNAEDPANPFRRGRRSISEAVRSTDAMEMGSGTTTVSSPATWLGVSAPS
jgi:hypothetical protein